MSTLRVAQDPSKGVKGNDPFDGLPEEILDQIVDFVNPEPNQIVPTEHRHFLSVRDFDDIPILPRGSMINVHNFRLVSRRFADVGTRILCTRVVVRFSTEEFERLERLANWKHLARHVKRLTYMVPRVYDAQILTSLRADSRLDLSFIRHKSSKQQDIMNDKLDLRALQRAIRNFERLQYVKILGVADYVDDKLEHDLRRLSRTNDWRRMIDRAWQKGFSHCLQTLGIALQSANESWTMFYSPHMSIKCAQQLGPNSLRPLRDLAAKLTCLVLYFDDCTDVDRELSGLSEAFKAVFTSATKMKSVHIGFSQTTTIPLEVLFHKVQWVHLTSFGIDGWELNAEEILGLLFRHKDTLSGLRLHNVLLKGDSRWKNVLIHLKDTMRNLEWISLRGIDYATYTEREIDVTGLQLTSDPPPAEGVSENAEPLGPQCSRNEHFPNDSDQLGDDGSTVNGHKQRAWEEWVMRGCANRRH